MTIKISEKMRKETISNPEKIAKILTNVLKAEDTEDKMKEHCWGVYLNSRNYIIRIDLISLGTLDANLIHPREVLKPAIESFASSLLISHNHPSGEVEPSEDDITLTKRLKEACKIMGIELLDHLIISENGKYYSFKDKGLF